MFTPDIDDDTGRIEHDSADVAEGGGDEHVVWVDHDTVGCFAAVSRIGWVERCRPFAKRATQVMFEQVVPDDNVDDRVAARRLTRHGGCAEDRLQCIGAALRVGAFHQADDHCLAVRSDAGFPIGKPFAATELFEHVEQLHARGCATIGVEIEPLANY